MTAVVRRLGWKRLAAILCLAIGLGSLGTMVASSSDFEPSLPLSNSPLTALLNAITPPPSAGTPNDPRGQLGQASDDPSGRARNPSGLQPTVNLGSVTLGGRYDSELGVIGEARYATRLGEHWAAGFLGEYGPNQWRLNGTLGHQLWINGQVKLTAEYLSQRLPFVFDSGEVKERVGQAAFGGQLRHTFDDSMLRNIFAGGYWAQAPGKELDPLTMMIGSQEYTNERRLAGSTSLGFNMGAEFLLTPSTLLKAEVLYDSVNFDTRYEELRDRSGLGGGLRLEQIISDDLSIALKAETRAYYDTYGAALNWQPAFMPAGVGVSFFAERFNARGQTPDSNIFGLNFNIALDGSGASLGGGPGMGPVSAFAPSPTQSAAVPRQFSPIPQTNDLLAWVKEPAVRMTRVMVESEQRTTLNAAGISGITPSGDLTVGGASVTITGSGFTPGSTVTFGGTPATGVTVVNATTITAIAPAHAAGVVDVVVTTAVGPVTLAGAFTYSDTSPIITSLSPSDGPTSGGTAVTISGSRFTGATAVTFGGTAATSVTVNSDTSITVVTPANAAGVVDVAVTGPGGTSSLTNAYTYTDPAPTIVSVSPTSGSIAGGTSVSITGTNFTGATAVNFGATAATSFTIDNATQITAISPAGSGTVDVTVTTPAGTSATSSADQFTYNGPAIIFVTNSTTAGNFGGLSNADALCNADSAKPSSGFAAGYTYKALLNGNNATTSGVSYYRPNGTTLIATATGGNLVGSSPLTNAIFTTFGVIWTGFNAAQNCSNWTVSNTTNGSVGLANNATASYWSFGTSLCNTPRQFYCVSQ